MDPAQRLLYARYRVTPVNLAALNGYQPTAQASSSSDAAAAKADAKAPAATAAVSAAAVSAAARNAPPPAEPAPSAAAKPQGKGAGAKPAGDAKAKPAAAEKKAAAKPAAEPKAKVDKSKDPTALRMAEEGRKRAELMKNMTPEQKKQFRKQQEEADKAAAAAAAATAAADAKKATEKKADKAGAAGADGEGGDESVDGDDVTVKVPKGTRDIKPEQMMIREQAFALIKGVFQRHGAVQIDTPVFELKETLTNKYGEDGGKLIYELADQGGELLALRYDLTVPFARYLATYKVGNIKRFHIGRVYRRDQPIMTRGRFREFYQCDFDIAGYEAAPPMLPDAECLKVLSEILDALPIGAYTIKLNHRKVLDAVMAVAGVPADKFRPVCSAIDKLDKEPWSAVETEIIDKLDPKANEEKRKPSASAVKSAKTIGEMVVDQAGEPFALLAKLQKKAALASNESAAAGFKELHAMCEFMKAFGMLNRVTLDMSLARGLDYYTGVIYEAVLLQSAAAGSADSKSAAAAADPNAPPAVNLGSIAAGGRYDGLVGMFSGKAVPAVGVSVGIERIFNLLEEAERKKGAIRKSHTQVLLCSAGKDMLSHKLAMATELWKAGIAAEYEYSAAPSPKEQGARADREMIPVTVWVGADELKKGVVTVKDMRGQHTFSEAQRGKNHGTAVARDKLVAHIKQLLASAPTASA